MKILLNMCYTMDLNKAKTCYYPLGLLSISAYIQKRIESVDIKIIDGLLELSDVESYKPDIVGISLLSPFYTLGCQTASAIHARFPNLPIVFGGHHITYLPNNLPGECIAGVLGEGEETFYQICKLLNTKGCLETTDLKNINSIIYWETGVLQYTQKNDLFLTPEQIPLINNYSLCVLKNKLLDTFHIIASRGCPFQCRFCSSSPFWKKVRYYNVEMVIDQIGFIETNYHPPMINFYDDLMIANKLFLQTLHDGIIKRNMHLKTSFSCWVSGKHFNPDVAALLKDMNVSLVCFGVESGSPEIYKFLKGSWNSPEINATAIRLAHSLGFKINVSVIVGAPPETVDDLKQTFNYIKSLPIDSGSVGLLKPFPGTVLWDEAKSKHLVADIMEDWRSIESDDILNPNTIFLCENASRKQTYYYFNKIKSFLEKKPFFSLWKNRFKKLFVFRYWIALIKRYLLLPFIPKKT